MTSFGTISTVIFFTLQAVLPSVLTTPPEIFTPDPHPKGLKIEDLDQQENASSFGNQSFAELLPKIEDGDSKHDVLEFLGLVKNASKGIRKEVESIDEGISGEDKKVLNSSIIMLKESTFQVMLFADHIRKKLELYEDERTIRLLADKLFGVKNRTSYTYWLRYNINVLMEDISHLKMHFTELSTLYEALMIGVVKLNPKSQTDAEDVAFKKPCQMVRDMFLCASGSLFVSCEKYCNGDNDCGDDSDEPTGCYNPFAITTLETTAMPPRELYNSDWEPPHPHNLPSHLQYSY